jgi:hypothetical protein
MNPEILVRSFPGTTTLGEDSNWIDRNLFVQYLSQSINRVCSKNYRLSSWFLQTSMPAIKAPRICRSNEMSMVSLPLHISNRFQPLNVDIQHPFIARFFQEMEIIQVDASRIEH